MPLFLSSLTEEQRVFLFGSSHILYEVLKVFGAAAERLQADLKHPGRKERPGQTGSRNASNDVQHALDLHANTLFIKSLSNAVHVHTVASEENLAPLTVGNSKAPLIVALDPLDGSDNLAVNGALGTLFSVYPATALALCAARGEVWPVGHMQCAAGYVLYGSATTLVCTTGQGVHEFGYCPSKADFLLCNRRLQIPATGKSYAINDSHFETFPSGVRQYITERCRGHCTARYSGALVADFHRHLKEGGIFLYPPTMVHKQGKLRLLFEANPLAFIAQQAEGLASSGTNEILSIPCTEVHQRTPLYIGSRFMVTDLLGVLQTQSLSEAPNNSSS